jgi:NAD+ synthase
MVDAYAATRASMDWHRRGNVQARVRMLVQFDLMVEYRAFPIGTGNKSERLFGYFTEHGDDAAKVQPLGDLFKTQVWQLAEHLALPEDVIAAAPSAGSEPDQTDEGDFGLAYATVDLVLAHMEAGCDDRAIRELGVEQAIIDAVRRRVLATHRKRLPTLVPQVQAVADDPSRYLAGAFPS